MESEEPTNAESQRIMVGAGEAAARIHTMGDEPIEPHDPSGCHLCPGCADRLYRIERTLDRMGPLLDVLEQAAPMFAAAAPGPDGKRPSSFKLAMAAAKLARSSNGEE